MYIFAGFGVLALLIALYLKVLDGKRGLGLEEMPPPYDDSFVRPPFGYVRRTECHGLSPYDWKWAIDFANRALGR